MNNIIGFSSIGFSLKYITIFELTASDKKMFPCFDKRYESYFK